MTVAHAPEPILQSQASASASAPAFPMDVPQAPDVGVEAAVTPRHSPTTRTHAVDSDDDHEAKRARVEAAKKQRLDRISSEYSSMITTSRRGTVCSQGAQPRRTPTSQENHSAAGNGYCSHHPN